MTATHTADVYCGSVDLAGVERDPDNANMVFATVVCDSRGKLDSGSGIWIAAAQVSPKRGMTREQASDCYRRTKELERAQTARLIAEMKARGACEPVPLTLHNWGRCGGQEPYASLDREFRYRQREIWDRAERLKKAFARHF